MEKTTIEWCDYTFNPWIGCSKVSAGCLNCYAENIDHRFGGDHWGVGKDRKIMSDHYWDQPLKWSKKVESMFGLSWRPKVFCASMADVFDYEAPADQRDRLWALIKSTQNLDWLLLTKRPYNIKGMLPDDWATSERGYYQNVWLGTSVENRSNLDRLIPLLKVDAKYHFVSCEPLLEKIDLTPYLSPNYKDVLAGRSFHAIGQQYLSWVIVGSESGRSARPMNEAWVADLRDQCKRANDTAFFYKQKLENGKKISLPILDGRYWAIFPDQDPFGGV